MYFSDHETYLNETQFVPNNRLIKNIYCILSLLLFMYFRKQLGQLSKRYWSSWVRPSRRVPCVRRRNHNWQRRRRTHAARRTNYLPCHDHHNTSSTFNTKTNIRGILQSYYYYPYFYHFFFSSMFDFLPSILSFLPGW